MIILILHRNKPRLMFINILHPVLMCVYFSTSPRNSATPSRCPAIQVNSVIINLKIALDPTG